MSAGVLAVMEQTAHAYAELRAKDGRGAVLADDLLEARATVERLIATEEYQRQQINHLRRVNEHLVRLLSSIHMRCAPPDVTLEDGRVMRFVPPDPEFYWRELSEKVSSVKSEMGAIFQEESIALARATGDTNER